MSELIRWSDIFLTGVDEMDSQHRTLVDMINHVYELLEKGKH